MGAASFHRFPWPNRGFVHAPDANTQYFTRPVGPETAKTLEKRIVAGRAVARASWEASGADFLEIRLGEDEKGDSAYLTLRRLFLEFRLGSEQIVKRHTSLYDTFFLEFRLGEAQNRKVDYFSTKISFVLLTKKCFTLRFWASPNLNSRKTCRKATYAALRFCLLPNLNLGKRRRKVRYVGLHVWSSLNQISRNVERICYQPIVNSAIGSPKS